MYNSYKKWNRLFSSRNVLILWWKLADKKLSPSDAGYVKEKDAFSLYE